MLPALCNRLISLGLPKHDCLIGARRGHHSAVRGKGDRGDVSRVHRGKLCDRFPILGERLKQPGGTLSGGEQQQLAIARGLMSRPALLMLDEPSLGLAPMLVAEMFKLVSQLRDTGVTILLVEQNVDQTLAIADRAYLLNTGRIEFEGTGSELRERVDVVSTYLVTEN